MLLNINMAGKPAVIIGGGKVACRKVKQLLEAGATVRVVAPAALEYIGLLAESGRIAVRYAHYQATDLEGMLLAVAATDDAAVNQQVAGDAGLQGICVCVADDSEAGTCSFPAVLRRGNLEIGVSTGGYCPALAVELREFLATLITEEYEVVLSRIADEREKLLTEGNTSTYNAQVLRSLARRLISELNERKDNA